jgi:hypothetical protein
VDKSNSKLAKVVAKVAVLADVSLIAITLWVTAFIAGAPITKESVFTGPITAAFAAHMVGGSLVAIVSGIATVATRKMFDEGNAIRQQVGNW